MQKTRRAALRAARSEIPYEITCPRCSARVLVVHGEWILFMGRHPVELTTSLDGDVIATCHSCGTLVPIDENLVRLN